MIERTCQIDKAPSPSFKEFGRLEIDFRDGIGLTCLTRLFNIPFFFLFLELIFYFKRGRCRRRPLQTSFWMTSRCCMPTSAIRSYWISSASSIRPTMSARCATGWTPTGRTVLCMHSFTFWLYLGARRTWPIGTGSNCEVYWLFGIWYWQYSALLAHFA